jgi:hypothetical protein
MLAGIDYSPLCMAIAYYTRKQFFIQAFMQHDRKTEREWVDRQRFPITITLHKTPEVERDFMEFLGTLRRGRIYIEDVLRRQVGREYTHAVLAALRDRLWEHLESRHHLVLVAPQAHKKTFVNQGKYNSHNMYHVFQMFFPVDLPTSPRTHPVSDIVDACSLLYFALERSRHSEHKELLRRMRWIREHAPPPDIVLRESPPSLTLPEAEVKRAYERVHEEWKFTEDIDLARIYDYEQHMHMLLEFQQWPEYIHFLQIIQQAAPDQDNHQRSLRELIEFWYQVKLAMQVKNPSITSSLSPVSLFYYRNYIIRTLRQFQEYLDPKIQYILDNYPIDHWSDRRRVREAREIYDIVYFLYLCLLIFLPPQRAQVYLDLQLHDYSYSHYVSKLVPLGSIYHILISADKVRTDKSHRITHMPVDPIVSTYLFFYIHYVRPTAHHERHQWNVILGEEGGKPTDRFGQLGRQWIEQTLHVPAEILERDERDTKSTFFHSLRRVGIAYFGIKNRFDNVRMRGYATAMRHSLLTAEKYYTPYTHWYHDAVVVDKAHSMLHDENYAPPQMVATEPETLYESDVVQTLREAMDQYAPYRLVGLGG